MIFVFLFLSSLSIVISRYPCCCKWHKFPTFYNCIVFHCLSIYHIFIHSFADGPLGCFLVVLAIISSAAMNIGVPETFHINAFSRYIPSILPHHMATLALFKEPPYCFLYWLCQFMFQPTM